MAGLREENETLNLYQERRKRYTQVNVEVYRFLAFPLLTKNNYLLPTLLV